MKKIVLALIVVFSLFSCEEEPTDELVKISTEFGDIHLVLYDETPIHKENFLKLAKNGFYDSTTFHRIISAFMIQGGDPNSKDADPKNDGKGGPGYTIEAEINSKFFHKKGALAAARLGDQQNPERRSSGSQFYIVQGDKVSIQNLTQMEAQQNQQGKNNLLRDFFKDARNYKEMEELKRYQTKRDQDSVNLLLDRLRPIVEKEFVPFKYSDEQKEAYTTLGGTPHLDGAYTVYGEVIAGLDVVDKIAAQKKTPMMTVIVETKKKSSIEKDFGYKYPVLETVAK